MIEKLASLKSLLQNGSGKNPKVFKSIKEAIRHTTKELEKFSEKQPKLKGEAIWGGKKK